MSTLRQGNYGKENLENVNSEKDKSEKENLENVNSEKDKSEKGNL